MRSIGGVGIVVFDAHEKLRILNSLIYGHDIWLKKFGGRKSKFPDTLKEERQHELDVLRAIAADVGTFIKRMEDK